MAKRLPENSSFVLSLTFALFGHFSDVVKDVFLVVALGSLVEGDAFFLSWVIYIYILAVPLSVLLSVPYARPNQ